MRLSNRSLSKPFLALSLLVGCGSTAQNSTRSAEAAPEESPATPSEEVPPTVLVRVEPHPAFSVALAGTLNPQTHIRFHGARIGDPPNLQIRWDAEIAPSATGFIARRLNADGEPEEAPIPARWVENIVRAASAAPLGALRCEGQRGLSSYVPEYSIESGDSVTSYTTGCTARGESADELEFVATRVAGALGEAVDMAFTLERLRALAEGQEQPTHDIRVIFRTIEGIPDSNQHTDITWRGAHTGAAFELCEGATGASQECHAIPDFLFAALMHGIANASCEEPEGWREGSHAQIEPGIVIATPSCSNFGMAAEALAGVQLWMSSNLESVGMPR